MSFDTDVAAFTGLVSYWKLEDTGATATDTEGANNGTYSGSPTQDRPGPYTDTGTVESCNFDGTDDSVDFSSPANLDDVFDGGGTVGCWMRFDGTSNGEVVLAKGSVASTRGWTLAVTNYSAGSFDLLFTQYFSTTNGVWQTKQSLYTDRWYYVVVTYDADAVANNPTIYVDGYSVPLSITTPAGTRDSDAADNLLAGRDSGGNFWTGRLSRVFISSSVLAFADIRVSYESARPGYQHRVYQHFTFGPVAYWKLDETSGDFQDSSGHGYDLTDNNTVTRSVATPIYDDAGGGIACVESNSEYLDRSDSDWRSGDSAGSIFALVSRGDGTAAYIFASHDNSAPQNRSLAFNIESGDRLQIFVDDGTTANNVKITTATQELPEADGWFSVCVTSSGTAYKLYVNGKSLPLTVTSGSNNGNWFADIAAGRDSITLGSHQDSSPLYSDTSLDEVMVFDVALTDDQVRKIHRELLHDVHGANAVDLPRVLVPFDDGVGSTFLADWGFEPSEISNTGSAPVLGGDGPFSPEESDITSVNFDGTDDYYEYGDTTTMSHLLSNYEFTIGFWMKLDDYTQDRLDVPVGSSFVTAASGIAFWYDNRISAGNRKRMSCWINRDNGPASNYASVDAGTNHIVDNDWHHICMREDATKLYLYVDGVEIGQVTRATINSPVLTQPVHFGASGATTPTNYFDGSLAGFVYFDSDMGADWPLRQFNMAKSQFMRRALAREPKYYYKMDETAGSTAIELLLGEDGTYVNTPTLGSAALPANDTEGTSVDFATGSDEYLDLPAALYQDFGTAEAWSMAVWAELPGSDPAATRYIYGIANSVADNEFARVYLNSSGELEAEVDQDAYSPNSVTFDLTGRFGDNVLVGFSYDGPDFAPELWLDGGMKGRDDSTSMDTEVGTIFDEGQLGNFNGGTGSTWDGKLDELVIFARRLTSREHYELFVGGNEVSGEAINCTVATGTWASLAANIPEVINGVTATGTWAAVNAELVTGEDIETTPATGTWASVQAQLLQDEVLDCGVDAATWAPVAAEVVGAEIIDVAVGTATWAPVNAELVTDELFTPAPATATWAAVNAEIITAELFEPAPAAGTWNAVQAQLLSEETFLPSPATGTWAAVNAEIVSEEILDLTPAAGTWAPVGAQLLTAEVIDVGTDAGTWAPVAAGINEGQGILCSPAAGTWVAVNCQILTAEDINVAVGTGTWATLGVELEDESLINTTPASGSWAAVPAQILLDEIFDLGTDAGTWAAVNVDFVNEETFDMTPALGSWSPVAAEIVQDEVLDIAVGTGTWATVQAEILSPHLYEMTPSSGSWAPVQALVLGDELFEPTPGAATWASVQAEIVSPHTYDLVPVAGSWSPVTFELLNEETFNTTPAAGSWAAINAEILTGEEIDVAVGTGTWAPVPAEVLSGEIINVAVGAGTWAPVGAELLTGEEIDVAVGAASWAAVGAQLLTAEVIDVATDTGFWTPVSALISQPIVIDVDVGPGTWASVQAEILSPHLYETTPSSGSWAPVNAELVTDELFQPAPASGSWAPVQATIDSGEAINCVVAAGSWAPVGCLVLSAEVIDVATDGGTWATIGCQVVSEETISTAVAGGTWASLSVALPEIILVTVATGTWAPVQCELVTDEVFELSPATGTWAPVTGQLVGDEVFDLVVSTATWAPVDAQINEAQIIQTSPAAGSWASVGCQIVTDEVILMSPGAGSWAAPRAVVESDAEYRAALAVIHQIDDDVVTPALPGG